MKLSKSTKEAINYEREKYELIKKELYEQGVRENTLTEMTNCLYLANLKGLNIRMIPNDSKE